jgi:hypothetical protein
MQSLHCLVLGAEARRAQMAPAANHMQSWPMHLDATSVSFE